MKVHGAFHVHSHYSYDAKLSLRELRELFVSRGLRFVLMTEHTDDLSHERAQAFFRECSALSDEDFLFIPGYEVTFPKAHIIIAGLAACPDPQMEPLSLVKEARDNGAFTVFAHPHRSRYKAPEYTHDLLQGVEVWNFQYDGKRFPRTCALEYLHEDFGDSALAVAGMDFHRAEHIDGPHLEVEVDSLTQEDIMHALHGGRFTLIGHHFRLDASGKMRGFKKWRVRIGSAISTRCIAWSKAISGFAKRRHIPVPKSLRRLLRRLF